MSQPASITCRDFAEFLDRYLGRDLPDSQRFDFEAHMAVCPHCVAYLQTYEETIRATRAAFTDPENAVPSEVPEDLVRAVLSAARRP
jgi:anti-sigma factor RsiW